MTPTPFPSFQASTTSTARVVVERRCTLILYMCVKVMEALGQLGRHCRAFSGAVRLELSAQPRGIELVHRCLSEERRRSQGYADIYPLH